jgi:hypothetical protein
MVVIGSLRHRSLAIASLRHCINYWYFGFKRAIGSTNVVATGFNPLDIW